MLTPVTDNAQPCAGCKRNDFPCMVAVQKQLRGKLACFWCHALKARCQWPNNKDETYKGPWVAPKDIKNLVETVCPSLPLIMLAGEYQPEEAGPAMPVSLPVRMLHLPLDLAGPLVWAASKALGKLPVRASNTVGKLIEVEGTVAQAARELGHELD